MVLNDWRKIMSTNGITSSFHILLIEDNEHDRLAFCQALQKSKISIEFTECVRAEEALERIQDNPSSFGLVVANYDLPGMSGLELFQELFNRRIVLPSVILIESGSEHIAAESLKTGVSDYLIKDPEGGYLDLLPLVFPKVVQQYDNRLARKQAEEALRESEDRYRTIIETFPHGIEECDTSGIITLANAALHKMFGYAEEELIGTAIWDRTESEEQRGKMRQYLAILVKERPLPSTVYAKNITKDGKIINIRIDWDYKRDARKRLTGFISVITDITGRKRAEELLREQNHELALLNDMNNLLQACRAEEETYRVMVNVCKQLFPKDAGFVYMVDDSRTMLQEIACWGTPPPEPRVFDVDDCWALRLGKMHFIEHPDAGLLCSHLGSSPEHGYLCVPISASGGALGMIHLCFGEYGPHYTGDERSRLMQWKQIMAARLAEQYSLSLVNLRLRETLRLESIRDPLTGLYNRRHMEASLGREVLRAKRHGAPVAIIMLDIDHFKHLNDTYGHEAGDVVLRELATLVRQNIRGEDIACRYGGEEFLLILPDAPLEIATQRAEALRLRGGELQVVYQGKFLTITISLGVAAFPIHGPDIKDTVKAADVALYHAKKGGRNQVVVAPS